MDDTLKKSSKADTSTISKKPYEKPAFRYERVFETTALSCGKTAGTFHCGLHLKSS